MFHGALGEHIGTGGEHVVHLSEDASRVLKLALPGKFGQVLDEKLLLNDRTFQMEHRLALRDALPSEYLVRWGVLDEVFGLVTRFEGAHKSADGSIGLVISQPFIGRNAADMPTWEDMEAFLTANGFEKVDARRIATAQIADYTWYRQLDGVLVTDTFPRNFRIDVTGAVVPIDLIVNIVPPSASKILLPATEPFALHLP